MRGLIGEIITRFEKKGLRIAGMKMMQLSDEILNEHYGHLTGKPFFPALKEDCIEMSVAIRNRLTFMRMSRVLDYN